jgi:hypothetical protein
MLICDFRSRWISPLLAVSRLLAVGGRPEDSSLRDGAARASVGDRRAARIAGYRPGETADDQCRGQATGARPRGAIAGKL